MFKRRLFYIKIIVMIKWCYKYELSMIWTILTWSWNSDFDTKILSTNTYNFLVLYHKRRIECIQASSD